MVYYNPLDKFYKSQIGAVKADTNITFRVKGNFDSVVFVFKKDGEDSCCNEVPLIKNDDFFQVEIKFTRGLYFYCFKVDDKFIGNSNSYKGFVTDKPIWFQLSVYDSEYYIPEWIYGGLIYQIFPDRFCSSIKKVVPKNKFLHDNWDDVPFYKPNELGKVLII